MIERKKKRKKKKEKKRSNKLSSVLEAVSFHSKVGFKKKKKKFKSIHSTRFDLVQRLK